MKYLGFVLSTLVVLPVGSQAAPLFNGLFTADGFAVLGGSTVTNTGSSTVYGNLGVSPGSAITGFPPGTVTGGDIHAGTILAAQAQSDLTDAYVAIAGLPCGTTLGTELGGQTLTPGIYCFASEAGLTGTLTLDAQGALDAQFIFQIASTLITASDSSVVFINGGQGGGLFWQVGSSATLGTNTSFAGNILALTSITLNTGATIDCGRALARNGAVTMDANNVSIENTASCQSTNVEAIPEPSSASLLLLVGVPGLVWLRRIRSARS